MTIDPNILLTEFQNLLTNVWIHLLFIVVIVDLLTGLIKAILFKKANSTTGLQGLIKHSLTLALILILLPYLSILNLSNYGKILVTFYIAHYGISILENLAAIGIPLPYFLVERLEKVRQGSPVDKYENRLK